MALPKSYKSTSNHIIAVREAKEKRKQGFKSYRKTRADNGL